jgi:glycosyltransferase involved in cell wall biosynthesis
MSTEQKKQEELSWDGVWIIIPAYNEVKTIRSLAMDALALCSKVIVVDDGSSDRTAEALYGLPVTLLTHQVNQGKAASLRTAFRYALERSAKCAISLDGDGQHCLSDAVGLLRAWTNNPQRIIINSHRLATERIGLLAFGFLGQRVIRLQTLNQVFVSIHVK